MRLSKRQLKRIIHEEYSKIQKQKDFGSRIKRIIREMTFDEDATIEIDPEAFGFEDPAEIMETLAEYEEEGYYIEGQLVDGIVRLTSDLGSLWYWWQNIMGDGPDQRDEMMAVMV